jgi:hypothetical protein
MCNPVAKASAHYLVTRTGLIIQMVRDQDTAYHAGIVNHPTWSLYDGTNPNKGLIGIEHECYPAVGGDGNLTEAQYQATLWLHRQLIAKYKIPVDSNHVIGHCQLDTISRKNCPGSNFPWQRLFADTKGQATSPRVNVILDGKALCAGIIINNRTYVQVAPVANALGRLTTWDGATNTVIVAPNNINPPITPNIKLLINNQVVDDITIIEGRSYISVTDLVGALGHKATWDGKNVIIQ